MMEVSYDLEPFMHKLTLLPNLGVVCGLPAIISRCNDMLLVSPKASPCLLSYDTTFCMGDYYVSALLLKCILFESSPVIPVLLYIHDSKTTIAHKEFFEVAARLLSNLSETSVPLVTDQERSITAAVAQTLPHIPHVLGWNHLLQDVKRFAKVNNCQVSGLRDTVRKLMLYKTEQEYEEAWSVCSQKWPDKLRAYFEKNVDMQIRQKLGRWIVGGYGCFDAYSGVTANQSEGFNTVMKVMPVMWCKTWFLGLVLV